MERDCYFDNAKAILIILVVVGHIIEPFIQANYGLRALWVFIYSFHMPVFIVLSGYFSRYIKDFKTKEIKYLGLFLLFTLIYWPLSSNPLLVDVLMPYYILWFLISLVSWYALLPIFKNLKHPIIAAFVIALLCGYVGSIGTILSLSRTFVFFPFFLIGYYFKDQPFKLIEKRQAVLIVLLSVVIIAISNNFINYKWLWGCFSYARLGHPEWYAAIYRLTQYIAACTIGLAFLSLIPRHKAFYTKIGQYTLWIFLFHGLIIKVIPLLE